MEQSYQWKNFHQLCFAPKRLPLNSQQLPSNGAKIACSLPSARNRSNIILGVPWSKHKEQGKFKDNVIEKQKKLLVKMKNNFCLVIVNKNNNDNLFKSIM